MECRNKERKSDHQEPAFSYARIVVHFRKFYTNWWNEQKYTDESYEVIVITVIRCSHCRFEGLTFKWYSQTFRPVKAHHCGWSNKLTYFLTGESMANRLLLNSDHRGMEEAPTWIDRVGEQVLSFISFTRKFQNLKAVRTVCAVIAVFLRGFV
jgi:hypothetical protein